MKKLNKETLATRREFLKKTVLKRVLPAVAVYVVAQSTPPLFGACDDGRPEPI